MAVHVVLHHIISKHVYCTVEHDHTTRQLELLLTIFIHVMTFSPYASSNTVKGISEFTSGCCSCLHEVHCCSQDLFPCIAKCHTRMCSERCCWVVSSAHAAVHELIPSALPLNGAKNLQAIPSALRAGVCAAEYTMQSIWRWQVGMGCTSDQRTYGIERGSLRSGTLPGIGPTGIERLEWDYAHLGGCTEQPCQNTWPRPHLYNLLKRCIRQKLRRWLLPFLGEPTTQTP